VSKNCVFLDPDEIRIKKCYHVLLYSEINLLLIVELVLQVYAYPENGNLEG